MSGILERLIGGAGPGADHSGHECSVVEYTRFPRSGPDAGPRLAVMRDASPAGMRILCEESLPEGSLLRVSLRDVDGRPRHTRLERVISCTLTQGGRYWLELEPVADS